MEEDDDDDDDDDESHHASNHLNHKYINDLIHGGR